MDWARKYFEKQPMKPSKFSRRIRLLRGTLPLALAAFVVFYQLFLGSWIHDAFGARIHDLAELVIYGIGGPLLAFLVLDYLGRWIEERETSELQSQILAETRENLNLNRQLSDDALQTLYAVSVLLVSLKSAMPEISPDKAHSLQKAEAALEGSMTRLREHLQALPPSTVISNNGKPNPSLQSNPLTAAFTETHKKREKSQ